MLELNQRPQRHTKNAVLGLGLFCLLTLCLASCGTPSTKTKKPSLGKDVSDATITFSDGESIDLTSKMSEVSMQNVYSKLDSDIYQHSFNASYKAKGLDSKKKYSAISERRITINGEKSGAYTYTQGGMYKVISASQTLEGSPYQGATYYKNWGILVAIGCAIQDQVYVDRINAEKGKKIIYYIPEYAPGHYTKKNLPSSPGPESKINTSDFHSVYFIEYIKNMEIFDLSNMISTITVAGERLVPTVSYDLTENYLIIKIKKPLGVVSTLIGPDSTKEARILRYKSDDCYYEQEALYCLNGGYLCYLNASFRFGNYLTNEMIEEGTFTIKRLDDDNTGYEKFLDTLKYAMRKTDTVS